MRNDVFKAWKESRQHLSFHMVTAVQTARTQNRLKTSPGLCTFPCPSTIPMPEKPSPHHSSKKFCSKPTVPRASTHRVEGAGARAGRTPEAT